MAHLMDKEMVEKEREILKNINRGKETGEQNQVLFNSVEEAARFASEAEKYIHGKNLEDTEKKSSSLLRKFYDFIGRITGKIKANAVLSAEDKQEAMNYTKAFQTQSAINTKEAKTASKTAKEISKLAGATLDSSKGRAMKEKVELLNKELEDLIENSTSKDAKKFKSLYKKLNKEYRNFDKSYGNLLDIVEKIEDLKLKTEHARKVVLSENPELEIAKGVPISRNINIPEMENMIAKAREYDEQHPEQEAESPAPKKENEAEFDINDGGLYGSAKNMFEVLGVTDEEELEKSEDDDKKSEDEKKYPDNHLLGEPSKKTAKEFLNSLSPEKRAELIKATQEYTKNLQNQLDKK